MKSIDKNIIARYMETHDFPQEAINSLKQNAIEIKFQKNEEKILAIKTLEFQSEHATKKGNVNYGTRETVRALKNLPVDATVRKIAFRHEPWSGLLFLDNASIQVIGVSIANSTAKKMSTPPNWDGSIETLHRFNKD